jgi:crossover junction endodeoxyribonuclease RuvC
MKLKKVLGIDPGIATVGYSVVSGTKKEPIIFDYGILTTKVRPDSELHLRLYEIQQDLESIIIKHKPTHAVIEKLFFFQNQKTVIQVAMARGVMMALLAKYKLVVIEPTPLQIKQSVTGHGRADKKQMIKTMTSLFKLDNSIYPDDAADALAMGYWEL